MRPICLLIVCALSVGPVAADEQAERSACEALTGVANLTITSAVIVPQSAEVPRYCYVRGIISPAIGFHVQMPLPSDWNGRFLKWGDGSKDGDLDFADHRLAQGYVVANSNMGHDSGAEPGASFAFHNRQAEIDFGYRAVHSTVNAAKTLIRAYYGQPPSYSYFEGCSTGGREGLMEAQRYPFDFDGIVAGAPVMRYQELNAGHTWLLQRTFRNDFAGNLAHDTDGDGSPDSLAKLELLAETVIRQCDGNDGIDDGVIDDPLRCEFDPDRDLAAMMCPAGHDAETCFTVPELQTIKDFYSGPYDSRGVSIIEGRVPGSERGWEQYVPYEKNSNLPSMLSGAANGHTAYLFYEDDPGMLVDDVTDLSRTPDRHRQPPEYAWWEFDIDDVTAGLGDFMKTITNAEDPDAGVPPESTVRYYEDVVARTFAGDARQASERVRLFMFPGMAHCGGGPGPNEWDALAPLVQWVENGAAPDSVTARHVTDGRVDNERRVCAYPEIADYTGPARGRNEPASWVAENFGCR
jgi:hypothetical protein